MIYIHNPSTNPYFNIALDEYLFRATHIPEDIVMLWQNDNAIIVGKHQNTVEEINAEYVLEHQIKVVRRITGGGAVYHDLGNLNFTYIMGVERMEMLEMKKYALPIVKALAKMGVTAEVSGRNDITIDGKKFSGTAQAMSKNRLLFHGTLLFNSDLTVLGKALNVKADKIQSKGVKSVRSRVTNISEYMQGSQMNVSDFKEALLQYLFEDEPFRVHPLSEDDLLQVQKLEKEKFSTWDWNYGASPPYNYKNSKRFACGEIEVQLNVVKGLIENCKIYGDFLGLENVDPVEKAITGCRCVRSELQAALQPLPLDVYFGPVTLDELLSIMVE
jgi:lipoate---protein ligase